MDLVTTDVDDIPGLVAHLRRGFQSHKTLTYKYRQQQLKNLLCLFEENKDAMCEALYKDLRKGKAEAILMEIDFCIKSLKYTLDRFHEWMAPQHKRRDLLNIANQVYTIPEPYGVALVISPWNYPIQLCLLVVIGAIAAGNACLIKPSESAVACSNLIRELIPRYLDNECYAVATGGVDVSQTILKERFDYILYTGSTRVGKIVMREAAKNLTPVTLELGGKSPVFVADDADLDVTAKRIVWGKFANAGQTCIAPDYVLCTPKKQEKLVECFKNAIVKYYGQDPKTSKDFGRIINDHHFHRLVGLIRGTGGRVVFGGDSDEEERYVSPTIVSHVAAGDKLMEEELFGPILPIITVATVDEAIQFVNDREKPLAFYIFTRSRSTFEHINQLTSAGGVLHNDTILHANIAGLPFGGVGHSGMGAYHFKYSFDTFSHDKPVLSTSFAMEVLNQKLRVPPYTDTQLNVLQWLLAPPRKRNSKFNKFILFCGLLIMGVILVQVFGVPTWVYRLKAKLS